MCLNFYYVMIYTARIDLLNTYNYVQLKRP